MESGGIKDNDITASSYFDYPYLSIYLGCTRGLGMESGGIKDNDITASSYFDYHSVGPHHAR